MLAEHITVNRQNSGFVRDPCTIDWIPGVTRGLEQSLKIALYLVSYNSDQVKNSLRLRSQRRTPRFESAHLHAVVRITTYALVDGGFSRPYADRGKW
jgi:hypothetical protein